MATNLMDGFQRDISYRVQTRDGGRVLLSATMRDRYHDILMEVVVAADTLVIEGVLAEFRACPTDDCSSASHRLQQLVGITIGPGLNRRIMEAMGGESGCGNLRNLLLGLLPLALNVTAAAGIADEPAMMAAIKCKLAGTCAGYPLQRGAIS